jgi:hypothetical protein
MIPYHKVNPFICRILKKIYEHTDDEYVKELVTQATVMAKKMNAKLKEYHTKAQLEAKNGKNEE